MLIQELIDGIYDEIVAIRRDLHQHPELGQEEFRTQQIIEAFLEKEGILFERIADTGVLGLIHGRGPGKTVGLRGDIDALPIQEEIDLPFKSIFDGKMHACGHDAHTAILLGAAKILNAIRDTFTGTVKLFFQPAEETIGGAKRMVEAGCMENPKVDHVIGLHVFPRLPAGTIEVKYDKMNASTDSVKIEIEGKSGHGAYPHDSIDAIVIAAHVITALQTLVSRTISPVESVVLSLGTIKGGVKGNVIADHVSIKGTLRTLDEDQRKLAKQTIEQIVTKTAEALGGAGTVSFQEGYRALVNDDEVVRVIETTGRRLLGDANVFVAKTPSLGAEDFSFFLEKATGAFYNIGCGNEAKGFVYKGHHPKFAVDEHALKVGMLMQVEATLALLE
ncbi:MAG TPA: amidohydrolase [Clostridiales bacterium UBA8960]|nr:amidohydrolase [Clostridiales bacterium UBA8960]